MPAVAVRLDGRRELVSHEPPCSTIVCTEFDQIPSEIEYRLLHSPQALT